MQARALVARNARRPAPDVTTPKRRLTPLFRWRKIPYVLFAFAMVVMLPPFVLVGGGNWLYRAGVSTGWSLFFSSLMTAGILTAYGALMSKTLTGKARFRAIGMRVVTPATITFLAFTLLYLSSVNAKMDSVREQYRSVHPMLRLAVGTAILADRALVVTAGFRVAADYDTMGLPRYENSLHFRQSDDFVHAVDLRTIGRSHVRNVVLVTYFTVLGFRTLRHVGTADHLHVSLPI